MTSPLIASIRHATGVIHPPNTLTSDRGNVQRERTHSATIQRIRHELCIRASATPADTQLAGLVGPDELPLPDAAQACAPANRVRVGCRTAIEDGFDYKAR